MPKNSAFVVAVVVSQFSSYLLLDHSFSGYPVVIGIISNNFSVLVLVCFIPAADPLKKAKGAGVNSIPLYDRRFSDFLKHFFAGGQIMISRMEIS